MSTWTFQNPSKKPHPGKNLSVSMRQNSKEALSPSIGVYIKAPVTSVGNRAPNELNWIETPNSWTVRHMYQSHEKPWVERARLGTYLMHCNFGALHLLCIFGKSYLLWDACLVLCIFSEVILWCTASLVHYIFGRMHLWYGESLVWWICIFGALHLWWAASLVWCIHAPMHLWQDASLV